MYLDTKISLTRINTNQTECKSIIYNQTECKSIYSHFRRDHESSSFRKLARNK